MKRFNIHSLESELNIDKLVEAETTAAASSNYDLTFDKLKPDNTEETKEEEVTDDTTEKVSSSENTDKESSEDNPDTTILSDEEKTDEVNVAKEELRNIKFETIATEDDYYSDDSYQSNDPSFLRRMFSKFIESLGNGIKYLYDLGIEFGPIILKKVTKGFIRLIVNISKLLMVSLVTLTKYINRRINSFNNLKNELNELSIQVKAITTDKEITSKFTNKRSINMMKIGSSIDLNENIKQLQIFTNTVVNDLSKNINDDLNGIKHSLDMALTGSKTPDILEIKLNNSSFVLGEVEGFESTSELIDIYHYKYVIPGDVELIAYIPKHGLTELNDLISAYNKSKIILGFNQSSFKTIESIDYMKKDELLLFLNSLIKICNLCISHQRLYENIKIQKLGFKGKVKTYFNKIVNLNNKQESGTHIEFLQQIYLKNLFVDTVYIVAAIDIHDYVVRVLTNAISYAKANLKQLS